MGRRFWNPGSGQGEVRPWWLEHFPAPGERSNSLCRNASPQPHPCLQPPEAGLWDPPFQLGAPEWAAFPTAVLGESPRKNPGTGLFARLRAGFVLRGLGMPEVPALGTNPRIEPALP